MIGQFSDFYNSLDPDPLKRGKQFEHFVKWFLKADPEWATQVDQVWLWLYSFLDAHPLHHWHEQGQPLAGVDAAPPRRAISRIHALLPKMPTTNGAMLF